MTTMRFIGLLTAAATLAAPVAAQTPAPEIVACYDAKTSSGGKPQGSGIVYRIKVPGVVNQQACVDADDVQFSWTIRHGALTGLNADDHSQYLLADGVRATTNGFAVTGTLGTGTIPFEGTTGVVNVPRLMWYPGKAAFRAGAVGGIHWNDENIGLYSTAIGVGTMASGEGSTALGLQTQATGEGSTALGHSTTASGIGSTALGVTNLATGWVSTAMGYGTTASGSFSTAMGRLASTNLKTGTFVYGDAASPSLVNATVDNSFVVRAQNVWFGRSGDQPSSPAGYFTVDGVIASTVGGFKFPDGTVQTTAAAGGASGTPNNVLGTLVQRDPTTGGFAAGPVTVDGSFLARHLTSGVNVIPGPGETGDRMMWYAGKAAFRAGGVTGDQWEDANVGHQSTAMGFNTIASGRISTAMGSFSIASGFISTAMGQATTASEESATAMGFRTMASGAVTTAMGNGTIASGQASTAMGVWTISSGVASTAMGYVTTASGHYSTAMGDHTTASGERSTAMGSRANTSEQQGSFVYGDGSTETDVMATASNQFVVRAAGGTIFYSNSDLTAGVSLAPGAGAWASVSDVNRKAHFREVDGEDLLGKIARMPIQEWSYKAQDPSVRHLGPTAQDFYAAFGLGESDTTITTIDVDGVNLLAVQALERRTAELRDQLKTKSAEVELLKARLAELDRRLSAIEAAP